MKCQWEMVVILKEVWWKCSKQQIVDNNIHFIREYFSLQPTHYASTISGIFVNRITNKANKITNFPLVGSIIWSHSKRNAIIVVTIILFTFFFRLYYQLHTMRNVFIIRLLFDVVLICFQCSWPQSQLSVIIVLFNIYSALKSHINPYRIHLQAIHNSKKSAIDKTNLLIYFFIKTHTNDNLKTKMIWPEAVWSSSESRQKRHIIIF